MKLLGALVVGAIGGPVLILATGYGVAFPGWALTIALIAVAPFAGAILLGIWRGIPNARSAPHGASARRWRSTRPPSTRSIAPFAAMAGSPTSRAPRWSGLQGGDRGEVAEPRHRDH